jgi:uncharacterized phiE125 gp8 family phage protein
MRYVVVITPPAVLPVSLDEAKDHLRVDHGDDDNYITRIVKLAAAGLDGPDSWLGRALIKQTLELRCDGFPGCDSPDLELPCPPLITPPAIVVTYADRDGTDQILDAANYRVIGSGGRSMARLALAYGKSWPIARWQRESLRVRYDAGYGATGADVPEEIRQAILLRVEHLYEHRGQVMTGDRALQVLPAGFEDLLQDYRIY